MALVGYETGIPTHIKCALIEQLLNIVYIIFSNCTKDNGSSITAYVHFLSKTTTLKNCRDFETLSHQPVLGVQLVKLNEINELAIVTAKQYATRSKPTPLFHLLIDSSVQEVCGLLDVCMTSGVKE